MECQRVLDGSPRDGLLFHPVALAKLETLANSVKLPLDRVLLTIEVEPEAPLYTVSEAELPSNWMALPYPKTLHTLSKQLLERGSYVGLQVPSCQSPTEENILLYPPHPQFQQWVKNVQQAPISFDARLKTKE